MFVNYLFGFIFLISLFFGYLATKEDDIGFGFLVTILSGIVMSVIVGLVGLGLWTFTGHSYESKTIYDVVSMEREMTINGRISGSFILGSGYIKSEPQYFCYVKVGENEYKLYNFETEHSSLVLIDDITPHVTGTHRWFEATWMVKYFRFTRDYMGSTYKFIVPTKTIIREFKG